MSKITHVFFDFDGVFTDNSVYVFDDGREAVRCSRADGIGIGMLLKAGIQVAVISTEVNGVVEIRANKLGIPAYSDCRDKLAKVKELCKELDDLSGVVFMGNDLNDLDIMKSVGFAIAPADACSKIKWTAQHRTVTRGGCGAVREACEWITKQEEDDDV